MVQIRPLGFRMANFKEAPVCREGHSDGASDNGLKHCRAPNKPALTKVPTCMVPGWYYLRIMPASYGERVYCWYIMHVLCLPGAVCAHAFSQKKGNSMETFWFHLKRTIHAYPRTSVEWTCGRSRDPTFSSMPWILASAGVMVRPKGRGNSKSPHLHDHK